MDKMPNSETLELLILRVEHEGLELKYSETEERFMEELLRVKVTDYDQYLIYFVRYKEMRTEFTADFYD